MLETYPDTPQMSNTRAEEIINFVENGAPIKFCNITTVSDLERLAKMAYAVLGRTLPKKGLLKSASTHLDKKRQRLGLELSQARAEDLFNHLLEKEGAENPRFRAEDTIQIQREILRKALAVIARSREEDENGNGNGSQSYLITRGEIRIEEMYPLHG